MQNRRRQHGRRGSGVTLRTLRQTGRRSGIVILEFILLLPLLMILLLAVIEFSLIYQVNQQVAYASKFGAKLAAEVSRKYADNPNLGNFNTGSAPSGQSLKNRVDQYLATHQLSASCSVVLKHDACSIPGNLQENPGAIISSCQCGTPPTTQPVPGEPTPADVAYVQVTVALKLQGNVPNLLNSFGFALGNRTVVQTTTMRVETNNTAPDPNISATIGGLPTGYSATPNGGSLTCGVLMTIQNNPGDPFPGGNATINFDGSGSTDQEQASGLTYLWSGPGGSSGTSSTFNATFPVPSNPNTGPGNQGTNTANYQVTLTVTDSCKHSSSCNIPVQLRTFDSAPNP